MLCVRALMLNLMCGSLWCGCLCEVSLVSLLQLVSQSVSRPRGGSVRE